MAAAAQALGAGRQPAVEQAQPGADRFGPSGPPPSIQGPAQPHQAAPPAAGPALAPPVIPGAPAVPGSGYSQGTPGSAGPVSAPAAYAAPAASPAPAAYAAPIATPAPYTAPPAPQIPGMPPQGSPASAYAAPGLANAYTTQVIPVTPASYANPAASGLGVAGSATGGQAPQEHGDAVEFVPANDVERDLQDAADAGNTDVFLSTLLLANVLVPVASHSRPGSSPGESGFAFLPEDVDGEKFLIVFTSKDRLSDHFGEPTRTVGVRFYELIRNWPDPAWSFAVNPGTPVGAKYPGAQIIALANWATEAGLGAEPAEGPVADEAVSPVPAPEPASDEAQSATVMQKTIAAEQVDYYLDRGYDRVAGFVHRASEVEHLRTPGELFGALGLYYDSSPFQPDAKEAFVLRWPAYRPSLYRIPYGGQNEQALRAMDGWVIERPPFRGNGFAPGEGRDVIAEFKVDSVRLPHGAQLWRIDADGNERMLAIFDADAPLWRRVGEQ
ncbi:SseB family protein [Actinoplanes missouriensis]|uniref:SseB family protein n=1 Tax=Actinoplanes missouriensis TaxID=1866 RepID=UPI0033CB9099